MTLPPPPWDRIVEWIPHVVWVTDNEGSTQYFNRRGHDLVGLTADETSGLGWLRAVHPDDMSRAQEAWLTALRDGTPYEVECRVLTVDGDYRWVVARALPVLGLDDEVLRWAGTWTDVDDIKNLEHKLGGTKSGAAASLAILDALQATVPLGIGLVDRDFLIVHMNDLLAGLNGTSPEEAHGRTLAQVLGSVWPRVQPYYQQVLDTGKGVADVNVARPGIDGLPSHWLTAYFPVMSGGEVQGVGVVMTDVSYRRREEEFHSVVMANIAEGLYALDARGRVTYVNGAASRMLGWDPEELLGKPMHETIHFQKEDGTPQPVSECPLTKVSTTGQAIRLTADAFTRKDGSIFPVSLSSAPLRSDKEIEGVVVLFHDITEERSELGRIQRDLAALSWLGRIRDAIDEDRMVLYSQPIIAAFGEVASEELLLRMMSRTGEVILPGAFLPVAEKYGLITEIDRWVAIQAIRLAAGGRRVEANLSAPTAGSLDILPLIESELRAAGADPTYVTFEITETALMGDIEVGVQFTKGLTDLGCGVSLDDFGTGFGSFTYLKRLFVQHLKIDVEFVRDILTNKANQHLVRAIVSMAKAFTLDTVAEGVEDQETWDFLRKEGVDFGQGFHLGRPAPIELSENLPTTPTVEAGC
jgi:PAS domain S-box-containing protein